MTTKSRLNGCKFLLSSEDIYDQYRSLLGFIDKLEKKLTKVCKDHLNYNGSLYMPYEFVNNDIRIVSTNKKFVETKLSYIWVWVVNGKIYNSAGASIIIFNHKNIIFVGFTNKDGDFENDKGGPGYVYYYGDSEQNLAMVFKPVINPNKTKTYIIKNKYEDIKVRIDSNCEVLEIDTIKSNYNKTQ